MTSTSRAQKPSAGPNVVAIGGGHGLAACLTALTGYAKHVTAIVSVADDGGSSGRLREMLDVPPPGDIRRCLLALADPDRAELARVMAHRFSVGELEGHVLGNLYMSAALAETGGFQSSVDSLSELLGVEGRVFAAASVPLTLSADTESGHVVGQVKVAQTSPVKRVYVDRPDVDPPDGALQALESADQIVLGPGSLFTSVLATLGVSKLRDAVNRSAAKKIYAANLRTQDAETLGFDVAAHLEALTAHGVCVDFVIYDPAFIEVGDLPIAGLETPLASRSGGVHDPLLLGAALDRCWREEVSGK